jgi:threonyl-tRNA synthetase
MSASPLSAEDLGKLRHSLAHVLAQAVLKLWPDTQVTIGPAIDTGCYYDFLFSMPITPDHFGKIEKEMRGIIHQAQTFRTDKLTVAEAIAFWEAKGQRFKVELIQDLVKNEGVTHVTHEVNLNKKGEEMFTDLCRGGHVSSLDEIPVDSFKLMNLAGAYWRGDAEREQLTRIYVAAFGSKEELDAHLAMLEEAKRRDHRKIGKEMDLFSFSDIVGPGLPLWSPKGTVIVEELEKLAKETESAAGYLRVRTPHIAKGALYARTGHLAHYAESMFPPMEMDGEQYYLKPMNCPHHHEIFASQQRSYRDLPLRLAEYGHCYRYEDSGSLFGLMRVRSLCMNDAHMYCTEEQFEQEFIGVINMYLDYFKLFGVEKYLMRLSLHAPEELGKKYVNNPALWQSTEDMVRRVLRKVGVNFVEVPDEAAFYGPKIDVQVWSAIGREFTLATNQVDFDVPGKVGLRYTDAEGQERVPLCIHRAPLSTHERFIGFLIEHFAGLFPLWLAPVQVAVLPVAASHAAYGAKVAEALDAIGTRFEVFPADETLGKRIRHGEMQRIPYLLVLGDREAEEGSVTVRNVHTKNQVTVPLSQLVAAIQDDVKTRKLTLSLGA